MQMERGCKSSFPPRPMGKVGSMLHSSKQRVWKMYLSSTRAVTSWAQEHQPASPLRRPQLSCLHGWTMTRLIIQSPALFLSHLERMHLSTLEMFQRLQEIRKTGFNLFHIQIRSISAFNVMERIST